MKLQDLEILGERIAVDVRQDTGRFEADYEDQRYTGETLAVLKAALENAIRRARATNAVPISIVDLQPAEHGHDGPYRRGRGVVQCVLRSRHERQNVYLLTGDDGRKFQHSTYDAKRQFVRRLTDDEIGTYRELAGHADAAAKVLEDWIQERRIDAERVLGRKP